MKTIKNVKMMLLFLAFAGLAAACSSDDDSSVDEEYPTINLEETYPQVCSSLQRAKLLPPELWWMTMRNWDRFPLISTTTLTIIITARKWKNALWQIRKIRSIHSLTSRVFRFRKGTIIMWWSRRSAFPKKWILAITIL